MQDILLFIALSLHLVIQVIQTCLCDRLLRQSRRSHKATVITRDRETAQPINMVLKIKLWRLSVSMTCVCEQGYVPGRLNAVTPGLAVKTLDSTGAQTSRHWYGTDKALLSHLRT